MQSADSELKKYYPIADMIANTFGKNCEVVIHNLSTPQNSVVYAVNNQVTGRQIGQPFEHLIRQVLLSKRFEHGFAANYRTYNKEGKPIKSSTALLENDSGEIIGAMCINFDCSEFAGISGTSDQMTFVEPDEELISTEENPDAHITNIVHNIIDNVIADMDGNTADRQKRLDVISFMDSRGVFLVKGAIDYVAEKLQVSRVTIYSYLDEIKRSIK